MIMTVTYHSPKNHEGLKKELKYQINVVPLRERERKREEKKETISGKKENRVKCDSQTVLDKKKNMGS